ncbi:MAG: hypothetical protein IKC63_05430 [Clostridia bacterium]|nr:hypothetical protein [Clostridia bacterium]
MKARRFLIFLLILTLFAPVGCEKAESTIELVPYTQPSVDAMPPTVRAIAVNISSRTIHLDPACPHVEHALAANLRSTAESNVNTLLGMGYRLCASCSVETDG